MIKSAINHERPKLPQNCPPELDSLIQDCWSKDPRRRPNAKTIINRIQTSFEKIKN